MITAWEELRQTGRLGESGAALLYRSVRAVAYRHRFPSPSGAGWSDDDILEVAHDFLTGRRALERLTDLAVRAIDDQSFTRLLDQAVVNHLRDRARETDRGALIRRLLSLVRADSRVRELPMSPPRFSLLDGPEEASQAMPSELARAASSVPKLRIPAWSSEHRHAPIADGDSLRRLTHAVLTAARGSLTIVDLVDAISARLDVRRVPLTVDLDVVEATGDPGGSDPGLIVSTADSADRIFFDLTDRERLVLARPDETVRALALIAGVGRSQIALTRSRLHTQLAERLEPDADRADVLARLQRQCESWYEHRTTFNDETLINMRTAEGGRDRDDEPPYQR